MSELLLLIMVGLATFGIVVLAAYILKRVKIFGKKKQIPEAPKKPTNRFDIDYDKLKESSSLRGPTQHRSSDNSRRGGVSAIAHMAETVNEEKGGVD